MANIGLPVRRYTVVPLEHPVAPTNEPQVPQPSRWEEPAVPVANPEKTPA